MTFLHSIARYWSPHLKHKPLAWGFSKGKMNRSLPRLNDEFSGGNGDLRVEKGSVPLLFSKRLRTWPTQCVMPPNLCKWISDPANLGTETLKYTRSPIIEKKKLEKKPLYGFDDLHCKVDDTPWWGIDNTHSISDFLNSTLTLPFLWLSKSICFDRKITFFLI